LNVIGSIPAMTGVVNLRRPSDPLCWYKTAARVAASFDKGALSVAAIATDCIRFRSWLRGDRDPDYTMFSSQQSPEFAANSHYVFVVGFEPNGLGYDWVLEQKSPHELDALLTGKTASSSRPSRSA
jgi:hypothetical protein